MVARGEGGSWVEISFDGPAANAESDGSNAHSTHRGGGMPRRGGIEIHIRVALYMWFCDHSGWWGVW